MSRPGASAEAWAPCAAVEARSERRSHKRHTSIVSRLWVHPAVIAAMTASNEDDVGHVDRALLIAALDTVNDVPHHLSTPIATAASKTVQALRIVLVSPLFDANPASDGSHRATALGTTQFGDVQRVLTYVYVQATKVAQEMGKILMEVDVLLRGENEPLQESVITGAQIVYQST